VNPDLDRLLDYPFERLRRLLAGVRPPAGVRPIALTIGEPQHPPPAFVIDELVRHSADYGRYPPTAGIPELRAACAAWAERRFALGKGAIDPQRQVLPVAGTREALFAFAQAVVDRSRPSRVVMPNPFYQIYEGAALLSGSQPEYVPCAPQCGWRAAYANVPADIWAQCQLLYVCSPANPTGAVLSES
jgi:N-succinyldiaminopimelate aminotransferase